MRWKFPTNLADACTSGACGSVFMEEKIVCMVSDDDIRSMNCGEYNDDDDGSSERRRRQRFRLITKAAQSIDTAVDTVVDRLLPAKNKSLASSAASMSALPNTADEETSRVSKSNDESGQSYLPTCVGVLDDESLVDDLLSSMPKSKSDQNLRLDELLHKTTPSTGAHSNQSKRTPEMTPRAARMHILPASDASVTSHMSDEPTFVEKRRWLGWIRRRTSEQAKASRVESPAMKSQATAAKTVRRMLRTFNPHDFDNETESPLSRYVCDDECTVTQEQGSIHTIRIHRVPTDCVRQNTNAMVLLR